MGTPAVHVGTSAWATGSTAPAPTYPTGIAAGDRIVVGVHCKPDTATINTPATYSAGSNIASTNGQAQGIDAGDSRTATFFKDAAGTETGTLTLSITSGNTSGGYITVWRKQPGATWDDVYLGIADSTDNTTWSAATSSTSIGIDDIVLAIIGIGGNDATITAEALAATGMTFSALSQRPPTDMSSVTGNDLAATGQSAKVTAGTPASVAVTVSGTLSAAQFGSGAYARLRTVNGTNTSGPQIFDQDHPAHGTSVTSKSFSAAVGDLFIIWAGNENATAPVVTTTGGGTLTLELSDTTAGQAACRMYSYVPAGSESITFNCTVDGSLVVDMSVWQFRIHGGIGTKGILAQATGSAPTLTLTAVAANSIIVGGVVDFVAVDPLTEDYRDLAAWGLYKDAAHWSAANATWYRFHGWQDASADNQTVGLTAPASMFPTTAAIEVKVAAAAALPPAGLILQQAVNRSYTY